MECSVVKDLTELRSLNRQIRKVGSFSYDTEATGLHPIKDRITMHVVTLPNEATYIIPVRMCTIKNVPAKAVKKFLGPLLQSRSITKHLWNAKIDRHFAKNDGMSLRNYWDAMVAGWMLDENELKSLKHRAKEVGIDDHSKFSWAKYFTLRDKFAAGDMTPKQLEDLKSMEQDMVDYAATDGVATERLANKYKRELAAEPVLEDVFNRVWLPGVDMLYHMERRGMCVDVNRLRRTRIACRKVMAKYEAEVYRLAGLHFNINSGQQLAEVLYEELGLPVIQTTKKGAPSTGKDTLKLLSMEGATSAAYGTPGFVPKYPILVPLLEYRRFSKLYSTYLKEGSTMADRIYKGRLHTSYNIVGTDTGRLSSSAPNLQNLPRVDKDLVDLSIRHLIVAPRGYAYIIADFSQFELRVIADVTGDKNMVDVFRSGGDIHKKTEDSLGVERTIAKNLNFGSFYGVQGKKFSVMLTVNSGKFVSVQRANQLIDHMFEVYEDVPRYKEKLYSQCRSKGYITTYLGRRRRIPDINSYDNYLRGRAERQAFNAKIQGGVADVMNLCMLKAHKSTKLKKMGVKMVGQVHDEVHFIVPLSQLAPGGVGYDNIVGELKSIFEHPFKKDLRVPIIFNCEQPARCWGEAK